MPWIDYVMEETSLIMEYNILQKLVLNTYLSALETEKKKSHITGLTKVNSTWSKELNGKSKNYYFFTIWKNTCKSRCPNVGEGLSINIYERKQKGNEIERFNYLKCQKYQN